MHVGNALKAEEVIKKVRRTVSAQWTQNEQIPWEHTSLIADFCFNTGQMVASPQIPIVSHRSNSDRTAFEHSVVQPYLF